MASHEATCQALLSPWAGAAAEVPQRRKERRSQQLGGVVSGDRNRKLCRS